MSQALGLRRSSFGLRAKEDSAHEMQAVTRAYAQKRKIKEPPYHLIELIGKGSFGRVFKSRNLATQEVVAVKIVEIDLTDYDAPPDGKDDTIKDTMHEISVLTRLKESGAENVNPIIDAFEFNAQFWIVTEYCPGGSVHTLMKASITPGLEEEFIIPIARELARGLGSIHAAGIVHRDIKCSNIFINENGRLQLGDFGIAGILENDFSKRSTVLGTPNWMPPEMVENMMTRGQPDIHYGNEVDCWSYGCVIYEMATGFPPYARVSPHELTKHLRENPLRLEGDRYSPELKDFVRFCLRENPSDRPSAAQILEHPFIANTETTYPAKRLEVLIERFIMWEQAGGQRASLFNPMGARGPEMYQDLDTEDEWNFSTTDEFQRRVSVLAPLQGIAEVDERSMVAEQQVTQPAVAKKSMTAREKRARKAKLGLQEIVQEERIRRGGALQQLFNPNGDPYRFGPSATSSSPSSGPLGSSPPRSDLPLRNSQRGGEGMIDLNGPAALGYGADTDANTIRASKIQVTSTGKSSVSKRSTMQWTFPPMIPAEGGQIETIVPAKRETLQWKFPASALAAVTVDSSEVHSHDSAVAVSNQKRDTMAWTFASAMKEMKPEEEKNKNCETMKFSFPASALPSSLPGQRNDQAYSALCSPALNSNMPELGSIAATTETASVQAGSPRMSIIDLDQALDNFNINGPSTGGLSSSFTEVSQSDPFDLEVIDRTSELTLEDPNMTVKGPPRPVSERERSDSHPSLSNMTLSSPFFDSSQLYLPTSPQMLHQQNPSFGQSTFASDCSTSNRSGNNPVETLVRIGPKSTLLYHHQDHQHSYHHLNQHHFSHHQRAPDSEISEPDNGTSREPTRLFQSYLPCPRMISATAMLPLSDAAHNSSVLPHIAMRSSAPQIVLGELTQEFKRMMQSMADHFNVAAAALDRLEAEDRGWQDRLRADASRTSSVSGREPTAPSGPFGVGQQGTVPMPIPVSVSIVGAGMGPSRTSSSPSIGLASSPPPFVPSTLSGMTASVSVSVSVASANNGM